MDLTQFPVELLKASVMLEVAPLVPETEIDSTMVLDQDPGQDPNQDHPQDPLHLLQQGQLDLLKDQLLDHPHPHQGHSMQEAKEAVLGQMDPQADPDQVVVPDPPKHPAVPTVLLEMTVPQFSTLSLVLVTIDLLVVPQLEVALDPLADPDLLVALDLPDAPDLAVTEAETEMVVVLDPQDLVAIMDLLVAPVQVDVLDLLADLAQVDAPDLPEMVDALDLPEMVADPDLTEMVVETDLPDVPDLVVVMAAQDPMDAQKNPVEAVKVADSKVASLLNYLAVLTASHQLPVQAPKNPLFSTNSKEQISTNLDLEVSEISMIQSDPKSAIDPDFSDIQQIAINSTNAIGINGLKSTPYMCSLVL